MIVLHGSHRCLSAFFIADQYIRALGLPGLADEREVHDIAHRVMDVAAGRLDVAGLAQSRNQP